MTLTSTSTDLPTSKLFLKHQHRSTLSITGDILQACMDAGVDGILISKISQKANLSYTTAMNNCQKLINADMIRSIRNERKHIFTITEKGIKFFKEFQKFYDMVKEINIRC
ncbi:MAG TPA: winged helix-turn-helix domain-containing protein [Nitrosopumilaceae archaeon]|nr:winged helix-turn-helix domain-containing protein [Nitrosopumilaceae archaeon]